MTISHYAKLESWITGCGSRVCLIIPGCQKHQCKCLDGMDPEIKRRFLAAICALINRCSTLEKLSGYQDAFKFAKHETITRLRAKLTEMERE